MKSNTIWVVFFSPSGSTEKVADTIIEEIQRRGLSHEKIDAAKNRPVHTLYDAIKGGDILFVGSPTYSNHPAPPVTAFLNGLPPIAGVSAGLFSTYGTVTSGTVLPEMGLMLREKGAGIFGAVKVVAVHSLLWNSEDPAGKGRPGARDLEQVTQWTKKILDKSSEDETSLISPEVLDYHREEVKQWAREKDLNGLKDVMLPMKLKTEKCTRCNICVENCPVGNIKLDPYPVLGDNCLVCFNCVRLCGPGALYNNKHPYVEPEIHKRKEFFKEPEETLMLA